MIKYAGKDGMTLRDDLRTDATDMLVRALMSVRTEDECYALLSDLCTIQEIQELAQRVEVARRLRERETYAGIAAATGVSTATISRVNRALQYGSGGYEAALKRMEATND